MLSHKSLEMLFRTKHLIRTEQEVVKEDGYTCLLAKGGTEGQGISRNFICFAFRPLPLTHPTSQGISYMLPAWDVSRNEGSQQKDQQTAGRRCLGFDLKELGFTLIIRK